MSEVRFGQACGKVILLGEHAVVYGVPAIAVGIDRGARASAMTLASGPSRLRVRGWGINLTDEGDERDLARAFRAVLAATRSGQEAEGRPVLGAAYVDADADLPPGGGLGCSAATGVAIARALDPVATAASIAERAMAWERVFHGNPSGVDAAVAAHGGCILFEKGRIIETLRARGGLTLCVGHTGIASSTKAMVEGVARLRARRPEVVHNAFETIRGLVNSARAAIELGDRFALGRLMDLNQSLLGTLFVSTPEVERLCEIARGVGALGAKLTGAGGGGSVIALVNNQGGAERVLEAWRREAIDGFSARVSSGTASEKASSEVAS